MMSPIRNGNFTSSTISPLVSWNKAHDAPGAPYYTYIKHKNIERRLGRAITSEFNSRPTSWGSLCEGFVHEILGVDYKYQSNETLSHPTISSWKGSPDHIHLFEESHLDAVCDLKCPKTLLSFCEVVDAWSNGGIESVRKNTEYGEKWYWQIVSNACITFKKYGEIILYCPYQDELEAIRMKCDGNPKYYWIWSSQDDELPYLLRGGHYKNLYVLRFIIPSQDKLFLHSRVEMASKELIDLKPVAVEL
jgi:hypothetical protein